MEAQISFVSSEFRSGQSISGLVILNLQKPSKIYTLSLQFVGESKGSWTEGRTVYRVGGPFWNAHLITGFPRMFGLDPERELVPAGSYRFEFRQHLPTVLPSSVATEFRWLGRDDGILYKCQVLAEADDWLRSRTVKQLTDAPFNVTSHLNLNLIRLLDPKIARGIQSENDSFAGCCCIPNIGRVQATLNLPKGGFALGEVLPMALEIQNQSPKRSVRGVRIRLFRVITYVGQFRNGLFGSETEERKSWPRTEKVAEVGWGSFVDCLQHRPQPLIDVPPKAAQTLRLPFPIPPTLPDVSTVVPVSIRLTYELEVKIKPGPCLRFPIVIGHVALNGSFGRQELEQIVRETCSKNEVRYLNQSGHPVQVETNAREDSINVTLS